MTNVQGLTVRDRLMLYTFIDKETTCWNWTGAVTGQGYASLKAHGRTRRAHRLAYEEFVGPIPKGLQLDHLCRNKKCINPAHLEPVTASENVRRSERIEKLRSKTHCIRGHSLENALIKKDGCRSCRECQRTHSRRSKLRKKGVPA